MPRTCLHVRATTLVHDPVTHSMRALIPNPFFVRAIACACVAVFEATSPCLADPPRTVNIDVSVKSEDGRPFEGVTLFCPDKVARAKGATTNASGVATFENVATEENGQHGFFLKDQLSSPKVGSIKLGGIETDIREWSVPPCRGWGLDIPPDATTCKLDIILRPSRRAFANIVLNVEPGMNLLPNADLVRQTSTSFLRQTEDKYCPYLGLSDDNEASANFLPMNVAAQMFIDVEDQVVKRDIPATHENVDLGTIEFKFVKNTTPVDVELTNIPARNEILRIVPWEWGVTFVRKEDQHIWTFNSGDDPAGFRAGSTPFPNRRFRIVYVDDRKPTLPDGTYFIIPGRFQANQLQLHVLDLLEHAEELAKLQVPTIAVQHGNEPSATVDVRALLTRIQDHLRIAESTKPAAPPQPR